MTEKIRANSLGLISIALLLFGSSDALAELKTFTLTLPTSYENGDPLPPAEIARTAVKCAGVDGGPYQERVSSPGGVTSLQADFVDGEHFCVATVTAVNPHQSVDARDTWCRIEQLLEEGFTKGRIALELGAKTPALQLRRDRVLKRTADAVDRLWRKYMTEAGA